MGQGRKAITDNMKVLQGTFRPCRENKDAPQAEAKAPEMPSGLTPAAKKYWKDISVMLENFGVITILDQSILETLCETYAEWKTLNKFIHKELKDRTAYEGNTQQGGVIHRPRPEISQRADAARRLQSLLSEFGLTPAARTKVKAISKNNKRDPWEDI